MDFSKIMAIEFGVIFIIILYFIIYYALKIMYKDINICEDIIKENLLVKAVEKAIGKKLLVGEEIVSDLKL